MNAKKIIDIKNIKNINLNENNQVRLKKWPRMAPTQPCQEKCKVYLVKFMQKSKKKIVR